MKICAVCNEEIIVRDITEDYYLYWHYAPRLGREKSLPVCFNCNKNFKHAAYIVGAKIQKKYAI